jgi:S-methylmethionine-dependent homocysteine/selenocysteine methylase
MRPLVLDGPMGTELDRMGIPLMAPDWTAAAVADAPDAVAGLHRAYAALGADVLTAVTFRTQPHIRPDWAPLLRRAVGLARAAAGPGQRVAGSLAPVADCYAPADSPADAARIHGPVARALAAAGADLLLCETFPHVGEGLIAVDCALQTGLPVWISFTAGPGGELLSPAALARGARAAADRGAEAVLINCTAALRIDPYVDALIDAVGGRAVVGVYANAGDPADGLGWGDPPGAAAAWAERAERHLARGVGIVGTCCGAPPAATGALAARVRRE